MIELSRLNGQKFDLNPDLIKVIESTPDTVITLTTGDKLMVLEVRKEVSRRIRVYRSEILKLGQLQGD